MPRGVNRLEGDSEAYEQGELFERDRPIPAPRGWPPYSSVLVWRAVVVYELERWAALRQRAG